MLSMLVLELSVLMLAVLGFQGFLTVGVVDSRTWGLRVLVSATVGSSGY